MTGQRALLIIDVQTGFIDGQFAVYQAPIMLQRIAGLIARARAAQVPVVYVQHVEDVANDGPLHPDIAPHAGEIVVSKMTPDSFFETDLQDQLSALGIKQLIIAGFQTELCVDTTCRRARSLGYDVTLVRDAHSTVAFDDAVLTVPQIIAHHSDVLGAFATVTPAEDIRFQ